MSLTLQADETGSLVLPPGARTNRNRLREEPFDPIAAKAKVQWLDEFLKTLPDSPPIPVEATRRDAFYED